MSEERKIPEGFYWKPADPVEHMYIGDKGTTKDGRVVTFISTYYPQQRQVVFCVDGSDEIIDLPLSEASGLVTPNENRVEGFGYIEAEEKEKP